MAFYTTDWGNMIVNFSKKYNKSYLVKIRYDETYYIVKFIPSIDSLKV